MYYAPEIINEITTIARTYLRDFPKFFQVSFPGAGRTYELGNPNIDVDTIWIAKYVSGSPVALTASQYTLDARNGILRLATTPAAGTTVMVEGYYYEWILPSDLEFFAKHSIEEHTYNLDVNVENMTKVIINTIGIATLVDALWALLSEYSRDIDVMTSESVHIPGSQRFRMVESLLDYWIKQYAMQSRALNIGFERIEVMNLRRVSRLTNRYIPIYEPKEIGEYGPVERIYPNKDSGTINMEEKDDGKEREDVFIDTVPPANLFSTGIIN